MYNVWKGNNMKKIIYSTLFLTLILSLNGCSGKVRNMNIAPKEKITMTPSKGKAKIIFIRPSSVAFSVQSSIFEIKNKEPVVVGIVPAKKRIVYEVDPGKHLFMVLGESADFMKAELLADKTYVAFITPRAGWIKARFSLEPIYKNTRRWVDVSYDIERYQLLETSPATLKWAEKNSRSIKGKYRGYYTKWLKKGNESQPFLTKLDFLSKTEEFL